MCLYVGRVKSLAGISLKTNKREKRGGELKSRVINAFFQAYILIGGHTDIILD